jgi:DNA modification methylase
MRDFKKNIPNPIQIFTKHLNFMVEKNKAFYEEIIIKKNLNSTCIMKKGDSRKLFLKDNSINLVITSPPYVTSYEYAELHQISTLWFGYADDMKDIKENFVGTSSRKDLSNDFKSKIAEKIIAELSKKDKSLAKHSSNYFSDLEKSYKEIYRVLKPSGVACIILGNTEYKSVKIKNVEASIEILNNIGFKQLKIIKRKLSSKTFTPYRDKEGKFTNSKEAANKKIYNYEYILIFKK